MRGIAAALRFQIIDVLRIDLRSDVAGDVGVGDRNPVDRPGDLVPSAHVKLIVSDPCARNIVGNRCKTVAEIGAGSRLNLLAVDHGGGCNLFRVYHQRRRGNGDLLLNGAYFELEMQQGSAAGRDNYLAGRRRETLAFDDNLISSDGDRGRFKNSLGVGGKGL